MNSRRFNRAPLQQSKCREITSYQRTPHQFAASQSAHMGRGCCGSILLKKSILGSMLCKRIESRSNLPQVENLNCTQGSDRGIPSSPVQTASPPRALFDSIGQNPSKHLGLLVE